MSTHGISVSAVGKHAGHEELFFKLETDILKHIKIIIYEA
jgi:hypothetical protein